MNITILADYLANNDLEIQIANRDYATIFECIKEDFPDNIPSLKAIASAVEEIRQDPYMQMYILPKFERSYSSGCELCGANPMTANCNNANCS